MLKMDRDKLEQELQQAQAKVSFRLELLLNEATQLTETTCSYSP